MGRARSCEKAKELKSCLLCDEYPVCPHTEYMRDRYPFVLDHYRRVKEVGLKQHFKEEREHPKTHKKIHGIPSHSDNPHKNK